MYSDQWLGNPSALEIQPTREQKLAQQQLDRLVAAGLITHESSRAGSRPKKPAQKSEKGEDQLAPTGACHWHHFSSVPAG